MRLRLRHALLSSAISLSCSIGLAPPAHAQSFFQKLFGFGGAGGAPAPSAAMPQRPLPAYRFQYRSQRRYQSRPVDDTEDDIGPPDSGGPYRTMCVRACDGFYFPLRHSARRRNFAADIKSCRAACGEEARLYYYSEQGGSPDSMTDLAGRAYKDMPNAFAYRKALVSGCTCKPAPWSYEEVSRHRSYAKAAAEEERARNARLDTSAAPLADPQPAQTPVPGVPEVAATEPEAAVQDTVAGGAEQEAAPAPSTFDAVEGAAPARAQRAVERRRQERALRRKSRSAAAPARYSPGYATQMFAPQKSRYVWPGDAR